MPDLEAHLLVLALAVPLVGAMAALLAGRHAAAVAGFFGALSVGLAVAVFACVLRDRVALVSVIGGWQAPLGVSLRADGFSAAMLLVTAVVMAAAGWHARVVMLPRVGAREERVVVLFWVLFLGLWGALVAVFTANDLFTIYVALELLTFTAVPLVCLEGKRETYQAALRYLVFAVLGSLMYLLGTGLLYGRYGTLDIGLLAGAAAGDAATLAIVSMMVVGLLAKGALFPFHFWLPSAHAGAAPPASAMLSALVVKGAFVVVLRLWFDVLGGGSFAASQLLGVLGAAAIIYGSVLALMQERLKLVIAYSTVAQIGYLFLVFPLASAGGDAVLTAGLLQAVSHALAKASLFLAVGLIVVVRGSDLLGRTGGIAKTMPLVAASIVMACLSLVGLPPSGGFRAKWILLGTSVMTGQWWWAAIILLGGVLAACYTFKVLSVLYAPGGGGTNEKDARSPGGHPARVSGWAVAVVFLLAATSMGLGLSAFLPQWVAGIGSVWLENISAP